MSSARTIAICLIMAILIAWPLVNDIIFRTRDYNSEIERLREYVSDVCVILDVDELEYCVFNISYMLEYENDEYYVSEIVRPQSCDIRDYMCCFYDQANIRATLTLRMPKPRKFSIHTDTMLKLCMTILGIFSIFVMILTIRLGQYVTVERS